MCTVSGPAGCLCIYVYMYVCMYVCTYVCMYVCTYVRMYVCTYVRMYVCTYVRMYVCTYVRMYVCTYVRMYVRTYVGMYVYLYMTIIWVNYTISPPWKVRPWLGMIPRIQFPWFQVRWRREVTFFLAQVLFGGERLHHVLIQRLWFDQATCWPS